MKKTLLVAAAVLTALLFVSCGGPKDDTVDTVSAKTMAKEVEASGVEFSANAKAVESAESFEKDVLPAIESDLEYAMAQASSVISLTTSSKKRAAITEDDLNKSSEDLQKQVKDFSNSISEGVKNLAAGKEIGASLDWEAPTGDVKVSDGVEFTISDAAVSADVSITPPTAEDTALKFDASGKVSMDYSGTVNLKKAANIDTIPLAKISVCANGKASVAGSVDYTKIVTTVAGLMMSSKTPDTSSLNIKELAGDIDGSVKAYVGYSTGYVFNTANFAGIITVDAEITAKEDINAETLEKYLGLVMTLKGEPTKEFFDKLPVDASLYVTVYDKDGTKQFDYIKAESLYDVYTKGKDFVGF